MTCTPNLPIRRLHVSTASKDLVILYNSTPEVCDQWESDYVHCPQTHSSQSPLLCPRSLNTDQKDKGKGPRYYVLFQEPRALS